MPLALYLREKNATIKFASFREHVDITPVGGTIDVSDLKLLFLYCIYEASSNQKNHQF